ncbi:DUF3006 domain-containing protein [Rummeliibacillus sp. JY-2-4R]
MQKGIIDRFEGDLAIIEIEDHTIEIPKEKMPNSANVGDLIIINGDSITVDEMGTKKLKEEIEDLAEDLFED